MTATSEVPTAEAEARPVPLTSSTVPAGYTIEYFVEPKRAYTIDGVEVPSVTTVLGCLDKPGLPWWGMKTGVEGVLCLAGSGILRSEGLDLFYTVGPDVVWATTDNVVKLLTENKLTVNHAKDKAGVRGVGAHKAFEAWPSPGRSLSPRTTPKKRRGTSPDSSSSARQWVTPGRQKASK